MRAEESGPAPAVETAPAVPAPASPLAPESESLSPQENGRAGGIRTRARRLQLLRRNKIATDWNEFWFRRRDLTALGLFRIALGLTALSKLLMLLPVLGDYFSEKGTMTLAQSLNLHLPPRICLFDFLPPEIAPVFFGVLIVVAILFTYGAYTRMMTVLLFVGLLSIDVRDPWIVNSGDRLLSILLFFGIFAPMGAALSADRMWSIYKGDADRREPSRGAYWAVRLMQFQVCSMYFWSTYIKCQGQSWPGGEALYWTSRNIERSRFSLPLVTDSLAGINLLVYFTLLVEGLFPFLVWNKRTRPYAIAGGVLLHLGIEHMMTIQVFGFVVLSSYLLFFDGEEMRAAWEYLLRRVNWKRESVPVFYDGDCGFCTRCTWVLEAMDALDRFRILNFRDPKVQREYPDLDLERSEKELVLKTRKGRWFGGFSAFRWMFWRIPAMMPVTPLCYVPGVPWVGNKAYQWVADHRYLFKVDEGSACALPTVPPEKNTGSDSGG